MLRRTMLAGLAVGGLSLAATIVRAEDYPTRAITIIVPGSPGGAIDTVARLVGQQLSESLGPAGGGREQDRRRQHDRHRFRRQVRAGRVHGADHRCRHVINPSLYKKMAFDTVKDFEPVVLADTVPLLLVVPASLPVNNVQELIAYIKAHPDEVSYASSGTGQIQHMSAELFKGRPGVEILHVPYKGSTFAHPDLISGRVTMMFDTVAALMPQVQAGTLRPLAVTTTTRVPSAAGRPTMIEAGVPGYDTSTWGGFLVPAGTPKDIVAKLNAGINAALAVPAVKEKLAAVGITVHGGTPRRVWPVHRDRDGQMGPRSPTAPASLPSEGAMRDGAATDETRDRPDPEDDVEPRGRARPRLHGAPH